MAEKLRRRPAARTGCIGQAGARARRTRLAGELFGAGIGFAVTGDIGILSWGAALASLAISALLLSWAVFKVPEPKRGGSTVLPGFAERETDRRIDGRGPPMAAPDCVLGLS